MFEDDFVSEDGDECASATFSYNEAHVGGNSHVNLTVTDALTFDALLEGFHEFLHKAGFTYIGQLAALDDNGGTLYITDGRF
jgi:hypothetical protein